MGLELAEQLGWELPDVIFYPTGGGTGLIGMWKAFAELEEIGFIGAKRPRMVAVQAAGCAPMVRAFEARRRARAALGERAHHRLGHPRAAGDRRFSDPARGARERRLRHRGRSDEAIEEALAEAAREEGFCCARKAPRPGRPTAGAGRRPGPARRPRRCYSTAPQASNIRFRRPSSGSIAMLRSTTANFR